MRKLKKLYIKALKGNIYIEPYDSKHNEEKDRAKIYDSNYNYLDYIPISEMSKNEYKQILTIYSLTTGIDDFIENCLLEKVYDSSTSIDYLLYSIYDDAEIEVIEELDNDIKNLPIEELILKYEINQIGDSYFYIGG